MRWDFIWEERPEGPPPPPRYMTGILTPAQEAAGLLLFVASYWELWLTMGPLGYIATFGRDESPEVIRAAADEYLKKAA